MNDTAAIALIGVKIAASMLQTRVGRVKAFAHDHPASWHFDPVTGARLWAEYALVTVAGYDEGAKTFKGHPVTVRGCRAYVALQACWGSTAQVLLGGEQVVAFAREVESIADGAPVALHFVAPAANHVPVPGGPGLHYSGPASRTTASVFCHEIPAEVPVAAANPGDSRQSEEPT